MIPIKQTRIGEKGNCLEACIASILELSIDEVTDFGYDTKWRERLNKFLRKFGYYSFSVKSNDGNFIPVPDDCFLIVSGPSPRLKNFFHAVVFRGTKLVHDPHPDNTGLKIDTERYWEYDLIIPIDPAKNKL